MRRIVGRFVALGFLFLVACGGTRGGGTGADAGGKTDDDDESSQCEDGLVYDAELGCVECRPDRNTCVGDAVHECSSEGTVGAEVETCDMGCSGGACVTDGCGSAAELVYVVDVENNFLSFDPEKLGSGDPFTLIGQLDCPAGPSMTGPGQATPFSMSVDRQGTAWVLYSSGEIFHVSTEDASCAATDYQPGQNGFELFGMGFVSDAPGSSAETLYLAGGEAGGAGSGAGDLAILDTDTLAVTEVAALPDAENNPELTGTGDAELFAYFPGNADSFVAEVDKGSAAQGQSWDLEALDGGVRAWAFAHWGGKFYVFITTAQGLGGLYPRVIELDPANPDAQPTVVDPSPYVVVGAGVSTCAPVVVD